MQTTQTTRQIKVPAFTVQAGPPTFQPPAAPRRIPFAPIAALVVLALLLGSVYVGWRVLAGSEPKAATQPAVLSVAPAPVEPMAGARPQAPQLRAGQEDAPMVLDTVAPAVETMRVSDQGVTQDAPTHQARYSVRGGPLPGAPTAEPQPQRVETYQCAWPRPVRVSIVPGVNPYRVEHHGDVMWLWWGAGTTGDPNYKQCRLQDIWEPFAGTWNKEVKP